MSYDKVPEGVTLQVKPYHLNIPQEEVALFYQLIKLSKLAPKTYENVQKDTLAFGVTHEWMSQAKEHWSNSYDWRKREDYINSFPNFTTEIKDDNGDDFTVHFAGLFSQKKDAIPIAFLHGWPGSFLEFLSVMNVLRKKYSPTDLPFHVIAPSLPGYGLSSGPPLDKDFTVEDTARIIDKLMVGLGFSSGYACQGGDIGNFTCRVLSTYPSCKAVHLNFCLMGQPEGIPASDSRIDDIERKGLAQAKEFGLTQSAYALEHGTRPATIGFALAASPISLFAWISEKFITWTDQTPPLDDILDSVSLYWFTESFPRCIYPYRQIFNTSQTKYSFNSDPKYYISKPFGYSYFPYELAPMPKAWAETTGKLIWFRRHERGGHFAGMEKPEELVKDVEEFLAQVWKGRESKL